MGKSLRATDPHLTALSQVLTWTDLVPDPNEPQFLLNPLDGKRFRRLQPYQERVAEYLVAGSNYRQACREAGMDIAPEAASQYVSHKLKSNPVFVNHLIFLINQERQSKFVTKESHLRRLDELGRRAEKEGKWSAAIAAEVNRGRVAGLYSSEEPGDDAKTRKTLSSIDARINELLEKERTRERKIEGEVVDTQGNTRNT